MKEKFGVGLFVGRFQPFHKGHLSALKAASAMSKRLIVGIGSSQESGTLDNPLSAKHRIEIIKAGLHGTRIELSKLKFFEIPDFHDNDKWFNYIIKKQPKISVVFTRNRLVKSIFRAHKIPVVSPQWHKRNILKAGKIRKLIKEGKNWHSRVPRGAVSKISARRNSIK